MPSQLRMCHHRSHNAVTNPQYPPIVPPPPGPSPNRNGWNQSMEWRVPPPTRRHSSLHTSSSRCTTSKCEFYAYIAPFFRHFRISFLPCSYPSALVWCCNILVMFRFYSVINKCLCFCPCGAKVSNFICVLVEFWNTFREDTNTQFCGASPRIGKM